MLIRFLFFSKTTLSTSRPQNLDFSSYFSKSRVGASCEVQTKQTVTCTLFCCQYSVQQTWLLRKHHGLTEVSVCAVLVDFQYSLALHTSKTTSILYRSHTPELKSISKFQISLEELWTIYDLLHFTLKQVNRTHKLWNMCVVPFAIAELGQKCLEAAPTFTVLSV